MTATVNIPVEYVTVLQALGGMKEAIQDAIRLYAIERVGERIGKLQREIASFQAQYGMRYEQFYTVVTTDEAFVRTLRQTHPTWERDFQTWEYDLEELQEWLGHLGRISMPS